MGYLPQQVVLCETEHLLCTTTGKKAVYFVGVTLKFSSVALLICQGKTTYFLVIGSLHCWRWVVFPRKNPF